MPDLLSKHKGTKRTCKNGHVYYKSSSCPVCPVCEKEAKPQDDFLSLLAAPARRAIQHAGITDLEKLSTWTEKDLLKLHGLGKTTIPVLQNALKKKGLSFKSN